MLDQCGVIDIVCEAKDKAGITAKLIDAMAALYANSCCLGYGARETEAHNETVRRLTAKDICVVTETADGLHADLIDIQSGCFSLVWDIKQTNHYMNEFECSEVLTFRYAFENVFAAYPAMDFSASLTVSNQYANDRYEIYTTENGALVKTAGMLCGCCGKIVTEDDAFWAPEDAWEYIEEEGAIGLCSLECAQQLVDDPDLDAFGLLDDYGDEINERMEE